MKWLAGAGWAGVCILAILFGRAAQERQDKANAERPGHYQMHVSPDGTITRLNTVTGQIHVVTGSGAVDIPERLSANQTNN